jgi:hypothetical protein
VPERSALIRWSALVAPVVCLLAFALCWLAYRVPLQASYHLAIRPTPLLFSGTHLPEHSAWLDGPMRWTKERATLTVRGLGNSPLRLDLRYFGGPQREAQRPLTFTVGATRFVTPASGDMRRISVLVPADAIDAWSGDLQLGLHTPPLQDAPDRRELGVALLGLDLQQLAVTDAGPQLVALQLALLGVLSLTLLRMIAVANWLALSASVALVALVAAALADALPGPVALRPLAAQSAALLIGCLLAALPLALLLRLTVLRAGVRSQESGASSAAASIATDRSQEPRASTIAVENAVAVFRCARPWLSAICCAVLLIFVVRTAGLRHPQFSAIDHVLRVNQIGQIAGGALASVRPELEQQWEWGTREPIPYALTSYFLFVPLARIWAGNELRVLVEGITVLLDASVPLLLWALLRGAPHGLRAAAFASLVYAALPIGYLFFHDGSFPTTIGLWASLLALVALKAAYEAWKPEDFNRRERAARSDFFPGRAFNISAPAAVHSRWAVAISLLALAIGMYVTQIAFVPFIGIVLASSVALAGGPEALLRARDLALATLAAALLGWFMFYGEYTLPVLQRTLPALLARIGADGSVGRSSEAFFGTAPLTAFAHMVAHFRLWPALLGLPTLLILLLRYRDRFLTHLTLAYAVLLAATLLAERWFGLWNKHVYFAAPGVALLAGLGLAWLWPRGTAGKLVCVALLAFTFVESWIAWGNRVLWYIMPVGAL